MANYVKAVNFAAKDSLPTGNPAKKILGTEIDNELAAVAAASATKRDITNTTFTALTTPDLVLSNSMTGTGLIDGGTY